MAITQARCGGITLLPWGAKWSASPNWVVYSSPGRRRGLLRPEIPWGGGELSYPDEGLEVLGLEGRAGYWFDHRAAAVARVLTRLEITSMWEKGSGTGEMASRLMPPLTEVITVELLVEGARAAAKLGLPVLCGTLQDLQLPDDSIECVGAFDVIEHIPEVTDFLR